MTRETFSLYTAEAGFDQGLVASDLCSIENDGVNPQPVIVRWPDKKEMKLYTITRHRGHGSEGKDLFLAVVSACSGLNYLSWERGPQYVCEYALGRR